MCITIYQCHVHSCPCMVAKDKNNFYSVVQTMWAIAFRVCHCLHQLYSHALLGTLPQRNTSFPGLLQQQGFCPSTSLPQDQFGLPALVEGQGGADDPRGQSGCAQLHAALWWWPFGLPHLCTGLSQGCADRKVQGQTTELPRGLQAGDEGCTAPTILFGSVPLMHYGDVQSIPVKNSVSSSIIRSLELRWHGSKALRGGVISLRSHYSAVTLAS